MNHWEKITFESHYKAALEIKAALEAGEIEEASTGLDYLLEAIERSERRALKSQLIRLMMPIIKWNEQPSRRSRSWLQSILQSRQEIQDIQEETPSLTNQVIESLWDQCFKRAKEYASVEMGQPVKMELLAWHAVFDETYSLEERQDM
jgi:hypothetical protein